MIPTLSSGRIAQTPNRQLESAAKAPASAEKKLQNVFSAVLAQAGKDGFASAEPLAESVPLEEAVSSSWQDWFNEFSATRYTFVAGSGSPSVRADKTADDLRSDYQQILVSAYGNGGYANPQAYLKTLSTDDLATIQQVQHLAEPIRTDELSEEAALNLLLPPDAQVDDNRDGLTAVGAAYTIRFPDSRTPSGVRAAWEAATRDMSEQDQALHVLQMASQLLTANMHFDANGQYVRSSQPGDADWVNPQNAASFSFKKLANDWLDYLKQFQSQMPPEQYERDAKFWSAFRENLAP